MQDPLESEIDMTRLVSKDIWADINRCFPYRDTPKDRMAVDDLFDIIDLNANGELSISQVQLGFREVIKVPLIPFFEEFLLKAFHKAIQVKCPKTADKACDVTKQQFFYLMVCMREYYELSIEFNRLDSNQSGTIQFEELADKDAIFEKWRIDPLRVSALEKNKLEKGQHAIGFKEFADWAIEQTIEAWTSK